MKLTELQVMELESHMLQEEEALKAKFKARNTKFETIKVLHNEVETYAKMGFIEGTKTARKTTMKRKKQESVLFEDEVWCMFYSLGFRILNKDEHLSVQWGPNKEDTQQLDVVAVGEDAIFVIECKAADKHKSHSFKKELNGMEQYMSGVRDVLRQIYGKEKKVKFIFATRNYRFEEDGEDINRMRNAGIFHLNDNSFNYISNLIKSYKNAVIYQFYGLMFKDELINNDRVSIPALRGKMGGRNYYLFSIEPSTLLKIGFVLHRTRVNDSMAPTYQRLLIPSRLKGITKFINDGGFFSNSIIINFGGEKKKLKPTFDPVKRSEDSKAEFGMLSIPNAYGIAYIIDGQHRIYGYANSEYKDKNTIPVVAFENMESEEQLKIFMEINENQKAVSPSLRLDLEEDLYWKSARIDSRMNALRSSIIKNLAANSNNILYNKISIGEDASALSFKPFDTALRRSGLIPKANATQWIGDNRACLYNINETDSDKEMKDARKRITQFVDSCYAILDSKIEDDAIKSDFIFSNRATFAIIALIGSLNSYVIDGGKVSASASVAERIKALTPYMEALASELSQISDEESSNIKGAFGQGADTFWLHSYQNMVNRRYPDYNPEELVIFKETQDKSVQEEGNGYKESIQKLLRTTVFACLENVYGRDWENNVRMIRHDVEGRMIKANADMDAEDWRDWMEVPDYRDIIDKNFSNGEFEKVFTIETGAPAKTKKEKLAWLAYVDTSKKKQQPLTRSDVNRLWVILEHLSKFAEENV